jgi:hypothetical protein
MHYCLCAFLRALASVFFERRAARSFCISCSRRCSADVSSFMGMSRQANSHDCGVMVAASTEWILSQFLSGKKFPWDAAGTRLVFPCAPSSPLIRAFRFEQLSLPRRWQQLSPQVCLLRSLRAGHAVLTFPQNGRCVFGVERPQEKSSTLIMRGRTSFTREEAPRLILLAYLSLGFIGTVAQPF